MNSAKSKCSGASGLSGDYTVSAFGELTAALLLEIEYSVSYASNTCGASHFRSLFVTLSNSCTGFFSVLCVAVPKLSVHASGALSVGFGVAVSAAGSVAGKSLVLSGVLGFL